MHHHKMWMYFHTELNDTLLLSCWTINSFLGMFIACIGLYLTSIFFEFLKWFRLILEQRKEKLNGPNFSSRRYIDSLLSTSHLIQTLLFTLQILISYILMLAIMTFSVWILLAICIGIATGFWLFGRRKPVITFTTSSTNNQMNPEIH
ncbi:hypothetical protein Mgra_00002574 [Meloidogyne graminicola]|uniref:Copper transport protein n=1 Tax=Meloidogyne graminicola TaxID=189291 RepID=A0A8S9ZW35_9BILA|nr:hypothetical protein Mgra_00002574 [Meloidogyne graminicola]